MTCCVRPVTPAAWSCILFSSSLRHYSVWPTMCMTLFYILILNSISLYMQYKRNESFLFYVHAYLNLKRIWNLNLSLRKEAESWNPIRQLMDQSHHPIIQDYPKILLEHRYRTVLKEFRQLWSTATFFFLLTNHLIWKNNLSVQKKRRFLQLSLPNYWVFVQRVSLTAYLWSLMCGDRTQKLDECAFTRFGIFWI